MYQSKINYNVGSEIVTRPEAKNYIRIETDVDDLLVSNMIIQARTIIENYISADIVSKARSVFISKIDNHEFVLPFAPVNVISSITSKGVAVDTSDYEIKGLDKELIYFNNIYLEDIQVNYETLGLNDEFLQQGILQMASTLYDNRNDVVFDSINELPNDVKSLVSSYKKMFF